MFFFNELCKNFYLYKNGFTQNPWKPIPVEGVNQSWSIQECKAYYAELEKQKKQN